MKKELLLEKHIMDLFPKVELHRHLEGTFCLDTLFNIAQKNKIRGISNDFNQFKLDAQFPSDHKPDFKLFLSKFRNDWYKTYEDINVLVFNSIKLFKQESLCFIELRFSPEHFSLKNNFDRIEVTKIIINAAKAAANEIGMHINFIITFNRNKQNEEEMLALYKKIVSNGITDIVGIDLAGDEILNPPEEFVNFFNEVQSDGIGITIHAGEVTPPSQIWAAIDLLHAQRIGHGTTSIKDPKLQEVLVSKKIILEQCPVSNHFTGSWIDTPNHPFTKLYKRGVLVTLNSDDPTVQNTNLSDDFITALKYYDISYQNLIELNIRAIEGSFARNKKQLSKDYLNRIKLFEKKIKTKKA